MSNRGRGERGSKKATNAGLALLALVTGGLVAGALRDGATPTPAAASYLPAPIKTAPSQPTALFMGDSFTEGTGADTAALGYAPTVAAKMGWRLTLDAEGGTGFLNKGPTEQWPDRTNLLVRSTRHDGEGDKYIVVAQGLNDRQAFEDDHTISAADLSAAVGKTLDNLHKGQPNAKIFVLGPWWPRGIADATPGILKIDDIVHDEAAKRGLPFVSPIRKHWVTADNQGWVTSSDTTHPTQRGHDYLAGRLVSALKAAGINPAPKP